MDIISKLRSKTDFFFVILRLRTYCIKIFYFRTVSFLLNDPVNDGGQWDMLVNLVTKYGLMPKKCFPETFSCESSIRLNSMLKTKLREFTRLVYCIFLSRFGASWDFVIGIGRGFLCFNLYESLEPRTNWINKSFTIHIKKSLKRFLPKFIQLFCIKIKLLKFWIWVSTRWG